MMQTVEEKRLACRAVIVNDGKVLIIRESSSYLGGAHHGEYDFPGGKVKSGETIEEALHREVKEECGLEVEIGKILHVGEWNPVVQGEQIHITGTFFLCSPKITKVVLGPDHDDYQWIDPKDRKNWNLIPLDDEVLGLL